MDNVFAKTGTNFSCRRKGSPDNIVAFAQIQARKISWLARFTNETKIAGFEHRLSSSSNRPWPWFVFIALLLAMQIKWWWIPEYDSSAYLSIARHISQGEFARFGNPHLYWSPGYPFLIAPAFLVADEPFLCISIIHFVLALLCTLAVYVWFRRLVGYPAVLLTFLVMVNVGLWDYYRKVLSEIVFMAFLMLGAIFLQRVLAAKTGKQTTIWTFLAILLIVCASCTRYVGVFLVVGFFVAQAIRISEKKETWRRALATTCAIAITVMAAVFALMAWDHSRAAPDAYDKTYLEQLLAPDRSLLEEVVEGARLRISEPGRLLIPGMYKAYARRGEWFHINMVIYGLFFFVLVLKGRKLIRKTQDPLFLSAPFYIAFYMIWPHDQSTRFMVPMLPVLFLCLWQVVEKHAKKPCIVLFVLAFLHAGVAIGYWAANLKYHRLHQYWPVLSRLVEPVEMDPGVVAVNRIDNDLQHMLRVVLDRDLMVYDTLDSISYDIHWLIVPVDQSPPQGFVLRTREGNFQLFQRSPPTNHPSKKAANRALFLRLKLAAGISTARSSPEKLDQICSKIAAKYLGIVRLSIARQSNQRPSLLS